MDLLDQFLRDSKKNLSRLGDIQKVRIVMGNCTCDLDSAVCALIQGYFEYLVIQKTHQLYNVLVIPLMNIPRREYVIKTEVVYFFNVHKISPYLLTFRDDIDLIKLSLDRKTLEVVLVDHHALSEEDSFLADSVIKVIDHRPQDANWPWHLRDVCIEPVGSCATLVASRFLKEHPDYMHFRILTLLQGAILIDTCNLSEKAERVTPNDIQMSNLLEEFSKCCNSDSRFQGCQWEGRDTMYSCLIKAKSDIRELSLDDLLIKDVKVVDGVPIVVLPILIRKFIILEPPPKPYDAICNFAAARNSRIVVLLGMLNESNQIKRDFCFFSLSRHKGSLNVTYVDNVSLRASEIYKQMYSAFSLAEPKLGLKDESTYFDHNGKWQMILADQTNLAVTRKTMVPIVRNIIKLFNDFEGINQLRPNFLRVQPGCSSWLQNVQISNN